MDNTIGQLSHFAIMGDQNNSVTSLCQLLEQKHDLFAAGGIQSTGRLVGQHNAPAQRDGIQNLSAAMLIGKVVAHAAMQKASGMRERTAYLAFNA